MTLQELSDLNFELAFYTSTDVDIVNDTAVKLINSVAENNGGICYIGKCFADKNGLRKYTAGDPLVNFCCGFVLPEYNANIDRIIKENSAEIYYISSMVVDAGGYLVFWK